MTAAVSATAAATAAAAPQRDQMKKTAQQFEAIFLRQLLSSARSASLGDDDLFGSEATSQFRDMADGQTADAMSQKGVFGIADLLKSQFNARRAPAATAAAATKGSGQ